MKLTRRVTDRLVDYLSRSISTADGRTYAGGLTKFEPGEMQRLMVPSLELLQQPDYGPMLEGFVARKSRGPRVV